MKNGDVEDLVRQMVWPVPSPDLRARILAAVPATGHAATWSDRIWFSQAWPFAGATAALAAIAMASWNSSGARAVVVPPETRASAHAVSDVGRALGIPEELSASLVNRTLAPPAWLPGPAQHRTSVDDLEAGVRQ
jgi:hypothetical protein